MRINDFFSWFFDDDHKAEIKKLEMHLEILEALNKNETERRIRIQTKGDFIIAGTSILSGVIIALSIFIQKEANITKGWLIVFASLTVLLAISITLTIFYLYKLNSKESFLSLSPKDIDNLDNENYEDYLKRLISLNRKMFQQNKDTINHKVDNMLFANKFVLCTSILFIIYTVLLLIWVCVR